MTKQLGAQLIPQLAWPKSLGTSPPTSRQGRDLAGSLTCCQPTGCLPGKGTVSVFTVDYGLSFEVNPPLALLRSALQSGRGARRLGVLSAGRAWQEHT